MIGSSSRSRALPSVLLMLLAALGLLGATAPVSAQAVPDVLNFADADAEIIVIVPNLGQASKKVSQFAEAIGMKDVPEMSDPLGALKKQLGIEKGVNDNGSMLVCISGLKGSIERNRPPQMAMLIPVSDYKAFIGNFEGAEEADGISTFTLPLGEPGYARNIGGYAVVGPQKDVIAKFKAGKAKDAFAKSAGAIGARYLASNDISIYVNAKALAAQVRPLLKAQFEKAKEQMPKFEGDGAEAKMIEMAMGFASTFFDSADAVLRDADSVVLGGDMSTKGVGFTATAQFREGTPLAKLFPGHKGGSADLISRLPNNPYLMASAMDLRGIDIKTMVDAFIERMPKDNWVVDLVKSSTAVLPHTKRMAQVYYAPANAASLLTGMGGVTLVETDDPSAYIKATKGTFDSMNKIKMDFGALGGQQLDFSFTTTYKENALSPEAAATVGAKVDEYTVKLNLPKAMLAQMGDAGNMVSLMLRTAGYVATVDKMVMTTTTVDTNLVKVGVEAIKEGNGLGSSNLIKQVREAGLPADASYETYINAATITQLFNQFSALGQMLQMPDFPEIPQIEVPNNLPPLAMGGKIESGGMSARFYVPMPVINWVKDVAMKFQVDPDQAPRRPGAKPAPF